LDKIKTLIPLCKGLADKVYINAVISTGLLMKIPKIVVLREKKEE